MPQLTPTTTLPYICAACDAPMLPLPGAEPCCCEQPEPVDPFDDLGSIDFDGHGYPR